MNNSFCDKRIKQALYAHAQELAVDMNLRLFLDQEKGFCWEEEPERALFVESIFIVDIQYPKETKSEKQNGKKGFPGIRRLFSVLREQFMRIIKH